jgi:hypothetical protein
MRATVRGFHSPDEDLESFAPQDPSDVGLFVQVLVGPQGEEGEESFDLMVCTPRWVERWVGNNGPLVGRHHLFVEAWDADRVRRYIREVVESEEASSWSELAAKIGRLGKWEFEDYRPAK